MIIFALGACPNKEQVALALWPLVPDNLARERACPFYAHFYPALFVMGN